MEQLLEKSLLFFTCFNPSVQPIFKYSCLHEERIEFKSKEYTPQYQDVTLSLEAIQDLCTQALKSESLKASHKQHLKSFKKTIHQFCLILKKNSSKSYNPKPAFDCLAESLSFESLVWQAYYTEGKIPGTLYTNFLSQVQQFQAITHKQKLS